MAKFGRPGKAAEILAGATLPEDVALAESEKQSMVVDDTERDVVFFTLTGSPNSRLFLTALGEVQRCVYALSGAFVPLRADSPRGIFTQDGIMVSFCLPVIVKKGQAGMLGRKELIDILVKTDPKLCRVLPEIEGGTYDRT